MELEDGVRLYHTYIEVHLPWRLRWCPLARLPLTKWLSIFVRADLVLSRKSFSASTTRGFWLLAKRVVPETLFS
jgi:hypothetical protein